jgi:hypothetical protein
MTLTNEQIKIMAQFVSDELGGEPEEYLDADFVLTRDSFDQFDGRAWHSWTARKTDKDIAFPNAYFDKVQVKPGHRRTSLWVVDFGDFRAAFNQ